MDINTEFHQTFAAVSSQRSAVYHWFADWLARERNQQDLEQAAQEDMSAVFAACGLQDSGERFQAALNKALALPDLRIDLAADFASAFLLAADYCATPYASWYLEPNKRLYGDAETHMRDFLSQHQLQLSAEFREPADHLAVFLSLFGYWIEQDALTENVNTAAADQAEFLQQALLSWLDQWATRCQQLCLQTDIYPALAALLLDFVQADKVYLEGA